MPSGDMARSNWVIYNIKVRILELAYRECVFWQPERFREDLKMGRGETCESSLKRRLMPPFFVEQEFRA